MACCGGCFTMKQIKDAVKGLGHKWFESGQYNVNIVGVRNSETEDNVTNKFDDCITVSYKDEQDEWCFHCFKATTDPGKYWVENIMNKKGVAILKEGQYSGSHKIRKHQGKYNALGQKLPMTVYRDKNLNEVYDLETLDNGIFGINIHKAGKSSTRVDKWSAGCQVIANSDDFEEFMSIMYNAKEVWGNSFTYTLINSNDIS